MAQIPPKHVHEMDQEYAKARRNLKQDIAQFRAKLADGDAPETVVLGFAQENIRARPNTHLAFMFATAVMALAEQEDQRT
jgi:hypothetical protein